MLGDSHTVQTAEPQFAKCDARGRPTVNVQVREGGGGTAHQDYSLCTASRYHVGDHLSEGGPPPAAVLRRQKTYPAHAKSPKQLHGSLGG